MSEKNEMLAQALDLIKASVLDESEGGLKKAPGDFGTYTPLHGRHGIYSDPGIEREVVSAYVRPEGISSRLPAVATVYESPIFAAVTGFTEPEGEDPDLACEDAPKGYMKAGKLTAQFGMLREDSQTIDISETMLKLHRGEYTDLQLYGRLLGLTNLSPSDIDDNSDVLNIVSSAEMVTVGTALERKLSKRIWQGSTALNQMPGLDSQIIETPVDITGTPVPALGSYVDDFGYDLVGGTGRDIVEYVSSMEYHAQQTLRRTGNGPGTFLFAVHPDLWHELTAYWPCAYNTNRCVDSARSGSQVMLDGRENVTDRDRMRRDMKITINGNVHDVVVDTGIYEHNSTNNANLNPGEFASSIYMIPLTIRGGFNPTYREYVDFRQAQPDLNVLQSPPDIWWTDEGMFSWSLTQNKWCYQIHGLTKQRVVLRTPHYAGKIQRIRYTPLRHLRSPYPESPYNLDGGVSLNPNAPNFSTAW